jgi:protein involved in polysaccharide export with SLBB domain
MHKNYLQNHRGNSLFSKEHRAKGAKVSLADRGSSVGLKVVAIIFAMALIPAGGFARAGGLQDPQQRPSPGATADSGSSRSESARSGPAVLVSPDEDYRIGAGDVLDIQIEDAPELCRSIRVNSHGTFLMPFLGRVSAQNRTTEELSQFIADGLRGRYLKQPKVSVAIKQYNSSSFFIQGAVHSPGVYQIEGHPSLLKLITLAGGLAENHGSTAYVIRQLKKGAADGSNNTGAGDSGQDGGASIGVKMAAAKESVRPGQLEAQSTAATARSSSESSPASGKDSASDSGSSGANAHPADSADADDDAKYELLKVNINGLLRGHFDQNMMISAGDIINIPVTDVFFVTGEVKAPGSFPLKEGTTLRQAISLAQGAKFTAASSHGIIFREDPNSGKREELKVDISAVMNGKQPDIPILANDVIIVPNSRFKSVSSVLLTGLGVSAARVPVY